MAPTKPRLIPEGEAAEREFVDQRIWEKISRAKQARIDGQKLRAGKPRTLKRGRRISL